MFEVREQDPGSGNTLSPPQLSSHGLTGYLYTTTVEAVATCVSERVRFAYCCLCCEYSIPKQTRTFRTWSAPLISAGDLVGILPSSTH